MREGIKNTHDFQMNKNIQNRDTSSYSLPHREGRGGSFIEIMDTTLRDGEQTGLDTLVVHAVNDEH